MEADLSIRADHNDLWRNSQLGAQQQENDELRQQLNCENTPGDSQDSHNVVPVNQSNPSHYDVGRIMRRWNLKYTGEDGQSIEHFLTRVEECSWLAGLSEKEILWSLSELLEGSAAIWYRNSRTKWKTWKEFTAAARAWYSMQNFQQRLKEDTLARTQGSEEPVEVYVAKLQALLRMIIPTPSIEEQVSIIKENMLPQLQEVIRIENIDDIETLLSNAVEAEMLLEKEKNFRPPPPADTMLLPEFGYEQPGNQNVERLCVAAIDTQEKNSTQSISNIEVIELLSQILEKLNGLNTQPKGGAFAKKSRYKQYRRRKKQANGKERTRNDTQQGTRNGQVKPKFKCYKCHEVGHKKNKCPKLQEKLQQDGIIKDNPNAQNLQQTSTTSSEGKCARSVTETEQAHKVCKGKRNGVKEDVDDVDSDVRWWLKVNINGFRVKALYDPGASRTVMGQIGLQLASSCKRKLIPWAGENAKLPNGSYSPIVGHVWLPFEVAGIKHDVSVAIMPELDADCFVGANFIRKFKTVHDPCENKLFMKGTNKNIDLEMASVEQTNVTTISSIEFKEMRLDKRTRVKDLLDNVLAGENEPVRCTTGKSHKVVSLERTHKGEIGTPNQRKKCYNSGSKILAKKVHARMDEMQPNRKVEHLRKAGENQRTEHEEEEPETSTSTTEDQEMENSKASEQEPANSGLPGENSISLGNKSRTRGRSRKKVISINRENAKSADAFELVSEAPGKRKLGRPKGSKKSAPHDRSRTCVNQSKIPILCSYRPINNDVLPYRVA